MTHTPGPWRLSIVGKNGSSGVSSHSTLAVARDNFKQAVAGAMMNPKVDSVILRDAGGKPVYQWSAIAKAEDKP
jgi:hypothetical protein